MIITDTFYLRQKSRETNLARCKAINLFHTLERELANAGRPGSGLAGIQIGVAHRACIIRLKKTQLNMINPEIIDKAILKIFQQEGCLSLPGIYLDTDRYQDITVTWFCPEEEKQRTGEFHGIEAVVVQHEIDHMDGLLITDRKHQKREKVGRNDPCPECLKEGINIKWKKCKKHNK